jgi:ketosteroid isomerase-like protein
VSDAELVRSIYARWARGDAAADSFHEQVAWDMPHPGGQVRGRRAVLALLGEFMATWEVHELELEEVRSFGAGRVLVLFTERGVGRGSGVPTEAHPAAIWTIADELVTEYHAFVDREEALAIASGNDERPLGAGARGGNG